MNDVEEESLSDLKSNHKKFKLGIKKTVIGIMVGGIMISTIPNIEYYTNLFFAEHDSEVVDVVESDKLSMKEKASILFENGVKDNYKIPNEYKEKLIKAFTDEAIDNYGDAFTEKYLYNMYASSKTVRVTKTSDLANKYGWWGGDFSSYLNTYSVDGGLENAPSYVIAHEQMHASLKKGLCGTGLVSFINGYGLNEGITSSFIADDYSYIDEYYMACSIGYVIGMDKLMAYYLNHDLEGLKEEFSKYLPREEVNDFVRYCDIIVFSSYFKTFLKGFKLEFNDDYSEMINTYELKCLELVKQAFENKTHLSIDKSNYGRVLFGPGSMYFNKKNEVDNNNEPFYYIFYGGVNKYKIAIYKYYNGNLYVKDFIVTENELKHFDMNKAFETTNEEIYNKYKSNSSYKR